MKSLLIHGGFPRWQISREAGKPLRDASWLSIVITCVCLLAASGSLFGATITVTNVNDTGTGSLRQAILTANGTLNVPDISQFQIPGPGPHTNDPATALPNLTDPLTIDGHTQSGASTNPLAAGDNAVLKIVIRATLLADTTNSTLRGLAVRQVQLGNASGPN